MGSGAAWPSPGASAEPPLEPVVPFVLPRLAPPPEPDRLTAETARPFLASIGLDPGADGYGVLRPPPTTIKFNAAGNTAYHEAARANRADVCCYLIENEVAGLDAKDDWGDTPLLRAVRQGALSEPTLRWLWKAGKASPTISTFAHTTLLGRAAEFSSAQLVHELAKDLPEEHLTLADEYDHTPTYFALRGHGDGPRLDTLKVLQLVGAPIRPQDRSVAASARRAKPDLYRRRHRPHPPPHSPRHVATSPPRSALRTRPRLTPPSRPPYSRRTDRCWRGCRPSSARKPPSSSRCSAVAAAGH